MKKPLVILFAIVSVLFLGLAIYYLLTPAGSLPHFLPGYVAESAHKHLKHGLAAFILALGSGTAAWFSLGKRPATHKSPEQEN